MKQFWMLSLLLVALLFWGWATQTWSLGILLGISLLLGFAFRARYDLETKAFYQIANFSALIVAAIFSFYWLDTSASKAIMPTLRLLPLAFLPVLLMQYVSRQSLVPTSAFIFFWRNKSINAPCFDMSALYLLVCMFSAGAMPHEGLIYFTGLSVLCLAWLLIFHHSHKPMRNIMIVLVFLCAESLGLGLVYGLNDLQNRLEAQLNAWLLSYHDDNNKGSTAIGSVGRLKLSKGIVFRVHTDNRQNSPLLLREATYQRYASNEWFGGAWADVNVPIEDEAWQLFATNQALQHLTIYQSFEKNKSTLALPSGTARITHLDADQLRIKQGGRVEAKRPPPFAGFGVLYTGINEGNQPITRSELHVAQAEADSIARLSKALNLYQIKQDMGEIKAIQVLHNYFWNKFTYSTWVKHQQTEKKQTALSYFLWDSKAGHCEYFATATVLLLREIGIPARYAVGYSMSEYDKSDDLYVVRGRDAHAWAEAWVNGQWLSVDNTPPNWFAVEDEGAPLWQDLNDMMSDWVFAFQSWRYGSGERDTTFWYWLLSILFVFLAYRVLRRINTTKAASEIELEDIVFDQHWQMLEEMLVEAGYAKQNGETIPIWFARINNGQWLDVAKLYTLKRYSKNGLNPTKQQQFEREIAKVRLGLEEEQRLRG